MTKKSIRLLVALTVLWMLVAGGVVFAEFLSRNPNEKYDAVPATYYFWSWSTKDLFAPTQQRVFEPNLPRIGFLLFGPPILFWVAGVLFAWVANGGKSK